MPLSLSDAEKRDIIAYIETGKPLPDKYRFLLFEEVREVELVWNGKTDDICRHILPFQAIEVVDEPRAEAGDDTRIQSSLFDIDARGRQIAGWTNKLIWGDNKLIMSSLRDSAMREEIERQGGIKLICIDPPFDVGADFSMRVEIGDDELVKKPNVLEELAYRDTWGRGADSFIAMIYERLSLMRELLADDGSIYVHCDWRVNSYIRLVLDEIFGRDHFRNEIIWKKYAGVKNQASQRLTTATDSVFWFSKSSNCIINPQYRWMSEEYIAQEYKYTDENGRRYAKLRGRGYQNNDGEAKIKYLDENPWAPITTLWDDDNLQLNTSSAERLGYPTQKPEKLLERIIRASSREWDLVADFFCGSGTTLAVAEKLGRKWIGSDLGKFAIHTTRKRMIGVQREMKKAGKDFRAFEILNLGKYERQHYIGVNESLRDEQKRQQLQKKQDDFVALIARAYRAERVEQFRTFHAKKAGRMVSVGPVDLPVGRLFVEEVIRECLENFITKVDILAFEYEMGLFPAIQEEAKSRGIDMALRHIPREVFDKRAIEKNQVQFHDVSYIDFVPHVQGQMVSVELTDFAVYYNQDIVDNVIAAMKPDAQKAKAQKAKVVVEAGNIVKVAKNAEGIVSREILTKKWTDWIDYWAVDFDFENKREIRRKRDEETGEIVEIWTGNYIFENEWQSFRTKKDRTLELESIAHEVSRWRHKIAVKVVDIFGNDTMRVVEISV